MNKVLSRRQFCKLTAASAAAAAATACWPAQAWAAFFNFTYRLHGDGWNDHNRRGIVEAAMNLVGNMSEDAVLRRAYRLTCENYHLTSGTWERTNLNALNGGLGRRDVLWAQLAHFPRATPRPVVNVHPYASDGPDWGRANLDLVTVRFSPGRFVYEGEFNIQLNFRRLGGTGTHSSPAHWAGVICHEMLHNLGHLHDEGDYRPIIQINALQQAVFEAARGSSSVNAAQYSRCGGRVR